MIDKINSLFSKMYLSDSSILHSLSDFFYNCACLFFLIISYDKNELSKYMKKIADGYTEDEVKKLKKDMMKCYFCGFVGFDEYVSFEFERLDLFERKEFMTDMMRMKFASILNSRKDGRTFHNKYETYKRFKKYYKRELVYIRDDNDYLRFEQFVKENDKIMLKLQDSSRGRGSKQIWAKDYKNCKVMFESIRKEYNRFLMEEFVQQSEATKKFNESSVNTVRVITILKRDGDVYIVDPIVRMGRKGAMDDHIGHGSIIAVVNKHTGEVVSSGKDINNNKYEYHPDTGMKIQGVQLPRWNELIDTVKELAHIIPTVRYVGWDMALTDEGWIMIEGNNFSQIAPQMADGVGRKKELDAVLLEV